MSDTPSTEVARLGPKTHQGMSSIELAPAAWQLAHRVSGTDFVPTAMRGKPEAVLACILTGHELGIGEMAALRSIHVIEGRPAMSAELMRAIVNRAGHEVWLEESTSTRVTVGGKRAGQTRETKVTWTMDDAKRAGLDGRQNWKRYPRAMLTARATAELCRAIFPDVLAGISHTVEELSDGDYIGDVDLGPPEVANGGPNVKPEGRAIKSTRAATGNTRQSQPATDTPAPRKAPPLPGEDDTDDESDIIEADVVEPEPEPEPAASEPDPEPPAPEPDPVTSDDHETDEDPAWRVEPPEDDHEPPPNEQRRYSGPQIIAMKFAAIGITDRDHRLASASAMIEREITSGNDLTPDEITLIIQTLNEDPDAAKVGNDVDPVPSEEAPPSPDHLPPDPVDEVAGAVSSGRDPAPVRRQHDPDTFTGDQWREILKRRGVKAGELLKYARTLGSGSGLGTLDDLAGRGIGAALEEHIEHLAATRGR